MNWHHCMRSMITITLNRQIAKNRFTLTSLKSVIHLLLFSAFLVNRSETTNVNNMDYISSSTDFITINVSNSKNDSISFEKKFSKSLTVAELKCKLEIITGGNAASMQLELYNGDKLVTKLNDDSALVGSYPIDPGMRLHVIDSFSLLALDAVDKFDLTDEQYESKGDTVRNFLRKNRLGKYNDEEMKELEEKKKRLAEEEAQKAQLCTVGTRCQVKVEGNPTKRGEIMYNGPIEGKKGIFIGVKYDLPLGKNDGSLDGRQYFKCQPNYGSFLKPGAVEVGNFPVECDDLDDEI